MPRSSERIKFLSSDEVKKLRACINDKALLARSKGLRMGMIEIIVIELGLLGLRASEIRNLHVGDVQLQGKASLSVKTLKQRQPVTHSLPLEGAVKQCLSQYLKWKQTTGESLEEDAPLIVSNKGSSFSLRGIEHLAKRVFALAGLDGHFSVHCLRHTAGVHLLRKTKNLRLVQKILRHSRIETTTLYADVMSDEIREGLAAMYD